MERIERIHVSVRARPLSVDDAKASPWRISGNSIFIPNQPTKFEFDQIFGENCKTRDVYNARTSEIVSAAVRGVNGTVFAYGQTSSGKTHTMRGSKSEPGVIPLAVYDLFDIIQQEMDREFLLRMSYMEIYNEEINDLLAPEHRKLQIHESIERGIFVAGLREEIVASSEQILKLMEFGESHRHVGETDMNTYSSRSHTIFRMIIESREKSADAEAELSCDAVRVSVLNLVDLAASERAAKTGAEGVRLREDSHINKSLMILRTVIKKLSEGAESQCGHVPYRDSKLTRILQPALGGNANTAIICNITLAQIHADETKSSLQFASRALHVTNCAHVNEVLNDAALLKRQKEIQELQAKVQGLHSEHLEEDILNLQNTLLKSEVERERMALELEEGKRAQAEQEKRLQEQAKKIKNLSSMVFCANREEAGDFYKKITILEMEKSSSQQNFNSVFDLATEQPKSPQEKYEKLAEKLVIAREEATLALARHRHALAESSLMNQMKSTLIQDLYGEIERLKAELEVYASREKNGVDIPKERYYQEESERKAMADQIEQMGVTIENHQKVEIERTIPKGSGYSNDFKTKKIFVGGIPTSVNEDDFKGFFSKYGKVVEHEIIRDHVTKRSRGFGFIVFDNEQVVDNLLSNGNMIDMSGTQVEIKKAEPKKPSNPSPAPAYGSDSRGCAYGDGYGGFSSSYCSFGSGGFGTASYRSVGSEFGGRFGDYGGYGDGSEFGGRYGDYPSSEFGYREGPLSYSGRFESYGGSFGGGGGYGSGLGAYGRGSGYGSYGGAGGSAGYESGPGASYGGAGGGMYGGRAGYSGSSRYHPYAR